MRSFVAQHKKVPFNSYLNCQLEGRRSMFKGDFHKTQQSCHVAGNRYVGWKQEEGPYSIYALGLLVTSMIFILLFNLKDTTPYC